MESLGSQDLFPPSFFTLLSIKTIQDHQTEIGKKNLITLSAHNFFIIALLR